MRSDPGTNVVVLVNENDEAIGKMEKMEVHRQGLLHRAISVFVFNKKGDVLLQQRASTKYHGALLWSNTCCSHPFPDEEPIEAASRRLSEELGFTTPLEPMFSFTYRAEVENGLIENEFDHVFAGIFEGEVDPDPAEVAAYTYKSLEEIRKDIVTVPEKYTQWFRIILPEVQKWWDLRFAETK